MSPEQFWPLIQVILVDLMLAADNAIVIGLAAASVPAALRPRVIMLGIAAAAVLRILFALLTVQLLQIVGLVLAGGLLLLWVCWKLWRGVRSRNKSTGSADEESVAPAKSLRQAIVQIIIADVSMKGALPRRRSRCSSAITAVRRSRLRERRGTCMAATGFRMSTT